MMDVSGAPFIDLITLKESFNEVILKSLLKTEVTWISEYLQISNNITHMRIKALTTIFEGKHLWPCA